MTENQWPQDSSYGTPGVTEGEFELRPSSTFPTASIETSAGAASKTDAAKDEAGEVTRQAADSAQNVAQTAKAEAANVAGEVKSNAKDLLDQARTDLTAQAATQQQKAAQGLHSISSELHTMADASDQPGVATDLIRQAAERSKSVATWLENRDPGSLLSEVKSFARQRPGTFLLAAAGAGILAGRLSRSLSAGAPDTASTGTASSGTASSGTASTGTAAQYSAPVTRVPDTGVAVPPPPVTYPQTTTAGFAETYPPNPLEGSGTRADEWAADPLAADPYRIDPAVAPDREDPFDGGRR
ncbi:hypothetical protein [Arthrobacter sp. UYEF3]|uniref:hypothetical protein n=1 Tax=Arthrobacter sp. UYEF3 TaxID=1756365 RepID=UPI003399821B